MRHPRPAWWIVVTHSYPTVDCWMPMFPRQKNNAPSHRLRTVDCHWQSIDFWNQESVDCCPLILCLAMYTRPTCTNDPIARSDAHWHVPKSCDLSWCHFVRHSVNHSSSSGCCGSRCHHHRRRRRRCDNFLQCTLRRYNRRRRILQLRPCWIVRVNVQAGTTICIETGERTRTHTRRQEGVLMVERPEYYL
jgi:hypothetical protein